MEDILYKAALTFQKINEYDYIFTLGNSHRQITITFATTAKGEFTHIVGLDHLKDIPVVTAKTLRQKEAVYKKILKGKITYNHISHSQYINSITNPEQSYDIQKRISMFQYADATLDNSYTGIFLKWNRNKSCITLSNGASIHSTIVADYLLVVPIECIPNEKMYFFMYQTNKDASKTEPIKLHIFSVFTETTDLTGGQEKTYTILKTTKYHIKTKKTHCLYTRPSFKE
jgi:hypothetical protein